MKKIMSLIAAMMLLSVASFAANKKIQKTEVNKPGLTYYFHLSCGWAKAVNYGSGTLTYEAAEILKAELEKNLCGSDAQDFYYV